MNFERKLKLARAQGLLMGIAKVALLATFRSPWSAL